MWSLPSALTLSCALPVDSKLEEVITPSVDEFVFISDNTYRREEVRLGFRVWWLAPRMPPLTRSVAFQILAMEMKILRLLDYHMSVATGFHFLKRFLLAGDAETLEILMAHVRAVHA